MDSTALTLIYGAEESEIQCNARKNLAGCQLSELETSGYECGSARNTHRNLTRSHLYGRNGERAEEFGLDFHLLNRKSRNRRNE